MEFGSHAVAASNLPRECEKPLTLYEIHMLISTTQKLLYDTLPISGYIVSTRSPIFQKQFTFRKDTFYCIAYFIDSIEEGKFESETEGGDIYNLM